MPRERPAMQWIQWMLSRAAARRREWVISPREWDTEPWAKEAVAEFIGSIHMEWVRERRDIGL